MVGQFLDPYTVALSVLITALLAGISLLNLAPNSGRRFTTSGVLECFGIAAVLFPTVVANLYGIIIVYGELIG